MRASRALALRARSCCAAFEVLTRRWLRYERELGAFNINFSEIFNFKVLAYSCLDFILFELILLEFVDFKVPYHLASLFG